MEEGEEEAVLASVLVCLLTWERAVDSRNDSGRRGKNGGFNVKL